MSFPWPDDNPLRFDRFMEAALFDPQRGYYARRISAVGRGGDFTTTAMISPALGRAVAAWAAASMKATGCRDLIELGPGEGALAEAMRAALPWWQRLGLRLHLVERSIPLREKQQARLKGRAIWHETIEAALAACEGRACIYSNEFVDAFPVRRFRREEGGWSELHVAPGSPVREIWQKAETLPDSTLFGESSYPVGQIIEVHESFRHWWQAWLPQWRAGRMLTIDYGAPDAELYRRRPKGTLRAYLLQQRLEDLAVYENAGRQDLTADVNFSDLDAWAGPWARRVGELRTQREFLLPHAAAGNAADAYACDEGGPGHAFRVAEHEPAACAPG